MHMRAWRYAGLRVRLFFLLTLFLLIILPKPICKAAHSLSIVERRGVAVGWVELMPWQRRMARLSAWFALESRNAMTRLSLSRHTHDA